MNYGYWPDTDSGKICSLKAEDEPDRASIQLYEFLAEKVVLQGGKLLEIGCGRGYGLSYLLRYHGPISVTGLDYSSANIEQCVRSHPLKSMEFQQGNAEALPFPTESFDVVINVESSHCYEDKKAFVDEARRVLQGGGYFLWADIVGQNNVDHLSQEFAFEDLELIETGDITSGVVESLDKTVSDRQRLISDHVPWWLRTALGDFVGLQDGAAYNALKYGDACYLYGIFRKRVQH